MTASAAPDRTRAAVLPAAGASLEVVEVALAPPGRDEAVVAMAATGVCHSDLSVLDGTLPSPYPVVLGHEGAGTVVAVGADVTAVAPGDRVLVSWLVQCGRCFYCVRGQPTLCETGSRGLAASALPDGTTRFSRDGAPVFHMLGVGGFAEHCVAPAAALVPLPASLAFAPAALVGCGVLTGYGAAVNAGRVGPGDRVVVLGCGGVGLNAIQGAVLAGAARVVAVDPQAGRRELARSLGATDVLAPDGELVRAVRSLTDGRGADVAIEAAGQEETIAAAVRLTRPGGRTVLVGAAAPDVRLSVPAFGGLVMTEKTVVGSRYGSSHVARDAARVLDLYAADRYRLDELVTREFALDEVAAAFTYCAEARGARAVVTFPGG